MAAKRRTRMKPLYARRKGKTPKSVYLRRGLTVTFLAVIAAVLLFGVYKGMQYTGSLFLSRNPEFALHRIVFESDGRLSSGQLREYAELETGGNLFAADISGARERLESVPQIESVTIERIFPDTLSVRVTERVAVAQIRLNRNGPVFLVDRHGVVLPATRIGQSLPLIEWRPADPLRPGARIDDAGVRQCLQILKEADSLGLGARITFGSFDLRHPEIVTVTVNEETIARFPHHSARERLLRMVSVLQVAGEQDRRVRTIDLTPSGRNVPVTYY